MYHYLQRYHNLENLSANIYILTAAHLGKHYLRRIEVNNTVRI